MASQTAVNRGRPAPTRVRQHLAELAHDAATLAELQVQLLAADLRETRRAAAAALIQIAMGAVLALGCVPVLLLAGAHALMEGLNWPASGAYAATGGAALVIAVLLLRAGRKQLAPALTTVERSRTELMETFRWLKGSLDPERDAEFADDPGTEPWIRR